MRCLCSVPLRSQLLRVPRRHDGQHCLQWARHLQPGPRWEWSLHLPGWLCGSRLRVLGRRHLQWPRQGASLGSLRGAHALTPLLKLRSSHCVVRVAQCDSKYDGDNCQKCAANFYGPTCVCKLILLLLDALGTGVQGRFRWRVCAQTARLARPARVTACARSKAPASAPRRTPSATRERGAR